MTLYRSKKHRKRFIQYGTVVISIVALTSIIVVGINKPIDYTPVGLEFEPVPQYHCSILDNLPENLVVEAEQGILVRPYKRFTDEEAKMLMKSATAEAEIDGIKGMCMVIQVILNRVDNDKFPNTIEEVIFQDKQFSSVSDGRYYLAEPDESCKEALRLVDNGDYDWVKALYFENADSCWQQDNCEYLYTVGHHRFYK